MGSLGRVLGPSIVCVVQCDAAEGDSARDGVGGFVWFWLFKWGLFWLLSCFLLLFLKKKLLLACDPVCCDLKIISPGHG